MRRGDHHQGGAMAPHAYTPTSVCRVLIGLAVLGGLIGLPALGRCADDGDLARETLRGLQGVMSSWRTSRRRWHEPGSPRSSSKLMSSGNSVKPELPLDISLELLRGEPGSCHLRRDVLQEDITPCRPRRVSRAKSPSSAHLPRAGRPIRPPSTASPMRTRQTLVGV